MSLAPKPLVQKKSTPNIRSLQAAFEGPQQDLSNKHPHAIYPPNVHRSNAGDLAPSANVSSDRLPSLTKSIDSVLDTPAAAPSRPTSPPNRPLARFRPSWIGPQPSKATKADIPGHLEPAMKQRVSINFASPGLQPPVYIFTSLSDPQWTATEMFPAKQVDGEFTFVRNFDAEEGEYQYKFRLGPGDWWVCDEKREVVDDGVGNRNNRIVVRGEDTKAVDSGHTSPERDIAATSKPPSGLLPKPATYAEPVVTSPADRSAHVTEPVKAPHSVAPPVEKAEIRMDEHRDPVSDSKVPKIVQPLPHNADFESEAEPYTAPLLRHESMSPTSHEQDHSPLFRHESIGLGYKHYENAALQVDNNSSPAKLAFPAAATAPIAPLEADPNDPSLHSFPTDHEGIISHIQRTHTQLPEDETVGDAMMSSPASSAAITDSSSVSGMVLLPSVDEEDGEQLEGIREAGEQEPEEELENGEKLDPLKEGKAAEAEDADFAPKIPELKVVVIPRVEKTVEEIMVIDHRLSLTEKVGTRNLMAIAVGLLAVVAAAAVVKMFT